MAILEGIETTIVVNGQDLHEYNDVDADPNTQSCVSKYVEATSGAEFQIKSSLRKSYTFSSDGVGYNVYVDGTSVVRGVHLMTDRPRDRSTMTRTKEGAKTYGKTGCVLRPFIFTELIISESTPLATRQESANDLIANVGSIVIKYYRKRLLGTKPHPSNRDTLQNLTEAPQLAEKQLKGRSVTHGARLGNEQTSRANTSYVSEYIDGKDSPIATFTFKYRSRKALQSLLLIDRTPSPPRDPIRTPLEERDIQSLSINELRELSRRQQTRYRTERDTHTKTERRATAAPGIKSDRGIKRERERDDEYDSIMASASTKPTKRPFVNGEVINLDD